MQLLCMTELFGDGWECLLSDIQVVPRISDHWECSPETKMFLFLAKREFQSNNGQFRDVPCLTTDFETIWSLINKDLHQL